MVRSRSSVRKAGKAAFPDPDQRAGGWIRDSGSRSDFRAPSAPLFIPQVYNLQSGMKPPSRRAQFSVYSEALGKSDQFEAPKEKKEKKTKENIDFLEKLTFGIIKSCDW